MITTNNTEAKNKTEVTFEGQIIKPITPVKLLGIIINETMNYKNHVNTVIANINNKIHKINHVIKYMTYKQRKAYMEGLVMSTIMYGIENWTNCTKEQMKKYRNYKIKW